MLSPSFFLNFVVATSISILDFCQISVYCEARDQIPEYQGSTNLRGGKRNVSKEEESLNHRNDCNWSCVFLLLARDSISTYFESVVKSHVMNLY